MSVAVSMARYLGATKLAVPSAGNAGGALAAYAARAGLEAHIFMPRDTPRANIIESQELGAHVTLIDGLITDCGAEIAKRKEAEGWFEMSTLKEPYRVEGKKTLGYELAEQLNWQLPDAMLYPRGGGTGLIGMWKAFDEMETLGWIANKRPRMFAVQAAGCAPNIRAFEAGERIASEFPNARTIASGLRVPKAIGDFLILNILRESNGGAIAIDDGDEFCERLRWLGVETPAEFQRITAYWFSAFTNHFLQFSQFVSECCVAAFLLQARKEKIEIVLTPQQFTQDLRVMSHLFQNRSVQWVQNS